MIPVWTLTLWLCAGPGASGDCAMVPHETRYLSQGACRVEARHWLRREWEHGIARCLKVREAELPRDAADE